MTEDYQHWQSLDSEHVWHPYTSIPSGPHPVVESAEGVYLHLKDGRRLIDGMSSWWCSVHGYGNPVLKEAAKNQIDKLSHVMLGGLTHAPVVTLCEKLAKLTNLPHVFVSDSGSVAVEVALKMALQYHDGRKYKFLTPRGGYHGDTHGCMSVSDPVNGMHHKFRHTLAPQVFVNRPRVPFGETNDEVMREDLQEMRTVLESDSTIAGIILEPIVQGAGGMYFYSSAYLKGVSELCQEFDVLFIADEIATGFGRTGRLWACEHANVQPDILCLGKALTGGMMSYAATLTTDKISSKIGTLMHGPTFMGNPLASAVSCASIDLLLESPWQSRVQEIESILQEELEPCRPFVHDVRVLGAIGVLEFREPISPQVQEAIVDEGVWLRPFGKLLYTMPPFIIQPNQLRKITRAMLKMAKMKF